MKLSIAILVQIAAMSEALAQDVPQPTPPDRTDSWLAPAEPVHIVGPIYYVGTKGLAAYLFATPTGHILLDGGIPQAAPLIEASIRKLGFDPALIRLLLISDARADHAGTAAHFKRISAAKLAVMDRDVAHVEAGGRRDPVEGAQPDAGFPPAQVDRVLTDGDDVAVGGVGLTARLAGGSSPGATTWITTVAERGRVYNVVFPCCASGAGHHQSAESRQRSLHTLELLRPDIWLGAHPATFDFEGKRLEAAAYGPRGWIDRDGYRRWLEAERAIGNRR